MEAWPINCTTKMSKICNRSSPIRIALRKKQKQSRRVSAIRLFCRRIQPPAGAVRLISRSSTRGGACLNLRTLWLSIAAMPLLRKKDARTVEVHPWRTMYDLTVMPHISLAATRSINNVSRVESDCSRTPTRRTYSNRQKHSRRACLAACLADAARGTDYR